MGCISCLRRVRKRRIVIRRLNGSWTFYELPKQHLDFSWPLLAPSKLIRGDKRELLKRLSLIILFKLNPLPPNCLFALRIAVSSLRRLREAQKSPARAMRDQLLSRTYERSISDLRACFMRQETFKNAVHEGRIHSLSWMRSLIAEISDQGSRACPRNMISPQPHQLVLPSILYN